MIATNSQTASDPASPAIPQLSGKSFADNAANVAKVATKAKMAGATNKMKMPAAQVERGTVQRRKTASKRRAVPNTKPVTPVAAKLTKGGNRQVTKTKRIAPPSKPVDREEPKLTKKVAK